MGVLIDFLLPAVIFLMIFSLGLTLTVRDFTRILRQPRPIIIGLFCQFIAVPLVVFTLVKAFQIDGYTAMGFMILAACPGGGVSNLIAKLAKSDVPLSVSLTSLSNLFSWITLPIILSLSARVFLDSDLKPWNATQFALRGFTLCTLPVLLGISCNHLKRDLARRIEPALSGLAVILLGAVIVGAVIASWSFFIANAVSFGGIMVALLIVMPFTGYIIARVLRAHENCARSISIETGIQNGAFGIAIGAAIQPGTGFSEATLAPALYGVAMYISVLTAAQIYRLNPSPSPSC